MKLIKFNFTHLIIIILLIAVAFQYFWPRPDTPVDKSKYIEIGGKRHKVLLESTTIEYVDVISEVPDYTPPDPKIILVPGKTVYSDKPIDTAAIIKAYYTVNYYEDVKPIDSIGTVTIKDTVFNNKIISRRLQFDYKLPEITNTIITEAPLKNKVFFGGGLGFNGQDFISNAHIGIMIKTKRDRLYGINVGAVNQLDNHIAPFIGGSIYWKIKLHRNR